MRLVKVLWQHQGVEEATWEREDTMYSNYPFLFEDAGMFFGHFKIKMIVANACDCMYMCVNFRDEILLSGKERKTWEKSNFF